MEWELRETGEMLEAVCTGICTQADFLGLVDSLAPAHRSNPELHKCFIDAVQAEFRLAGMGEFFVGEYAAKTLIGMRVALLAAAGQLTPLLENAAYNRGLKILLSDSRASAEHWLTE
jgi:hypothetical protein